MKVHTLTGYIQNIFLVEYSDKLLLLDGCGRADVKKVCSFIQQTLKRPLYDLKVIVVTHMHPDHSGGAEALKRKTNALLISHAKAPMWYSSISGRITYLLDVLLMHWFAKRMGRHLQLSWLSATIAPDIQLEDGTQIPQFPDWQVLHTPGHTDHDLSLYHAQTNQIYVADLIVRVKNRYHPPFPVYYPKLYKQSLQKLRMLNNPTVMFAHVKSTRLEDDELTQLQALTPSQPSSYFRSMKARIGRAFGLNR